MNSQSPGQHHKTFMASNQTKPKHKKGIWTQNSTSNQENKKIVYMLYAYVAYVYTVDIYNINHTLGQPPCRLVVYQHKKDSTFLCVLGFGFIYLFWSYWFLFCLFILSRKRKIMDPGGQGAEKNIERVVRREIICSKYII